MERRADQVVATPKRAFVPRSGRDQRSDRTAIILNSLIAHDKITARDRTRSSRAYIQKTSLTTPAQAPASEAYPTSLEHQRDTMSLSGMPAPAQSAGTA